MYLDAILCEGLLKEAWGTPLLGEEMFGDPSQKPPWALVACHRLNK